MGMSAALIAARSVMVHTGGSVNDSGNLLPSFVFSMRSRLHNSIRLRRARKKEFRLTPA